MMLPWIWLKLASRYDYRSWHGIGAIFTAAAVFFIIAPAIFSDKSLGTAMVCLLSCWIRF